MFRFSTRNFLIFDIFLIVYTTYVDVNNIVSGATLPEKYGSFKVCETLACKRAASSILHNMDQSVNPCDNFYRFACGNFVKSTRIPDNEEFVSYYLTLRQKVVEELRTSIENEITEKDPQIFKLLRTYYNTCMNEDEIEKTSGREFLQIFRVLGGWPVLEGNSWNESGFDWKELVYQIRKIGFSLNYFINFDVTYDSKNNARRLVTLDQASLGMAQEYLSKGSDDQLVKAYFKYMIDVAEIFGANREEASRELAESLNFEIELAKISLPSNKRRNATLLYNPTTVGELSSKYPYLVWSDYFNKILRPQAEVTASQPVVVAVPSFLKNLGELLSRTPRRVLANYAFWRMAQESSSQLSSRVRRAQRRFETAVLGKSVESPRWQVCVNHVKDRFNLAAGALYVRRHFDKGTKDAATELLRRITATFEQVFRDITWVDSQTRKAALEKLRAMAPVVAYPEELLDDKKLDDFYKVVQVYPGSFLKTALSLNVFKREVSFERLHRPVNKTDWTTRAGSSIVNALFRHTENTLEIPAAILQGSYFSLTNPNFMNFAAMGSVMGHEITHNFDDMGRNYDQNGNLRDWWTPETTKEYLKRAQCIVDQYGNYTEPEVNLKIDGVNTQGENIADNGGVKHAYFSYLAWEKKNGEEPRLPGLESYSSKQMYWIANANIWCTKYRPESLRNLIVTNGHTPDEFRVIGTNSNIPQFSEDFKCPVGSRMNPVNKCSVW